jgi:ubiquinone/menaquinone biosynthesis C-methylase UbiE
MSDPADALKAQYEDSRNFRQRTALHARFGTNRYGWYRWIFDQIELGDKPRILELGCGPGAMWKRNLERTPDAALVVVSDFSAGMLRDAAENIGTQSARVRFCQIDASLLPFSDNSFDTVIANMMLYHVPERPRAIRDIRRVLTSSGALYATTTGRAYMREVQEDAWRILGVDRRAASAKRFGLETGYEQLRAAFSQVETRRYESSLRVTETQPLMDYFLSMKPMISPSAERLSALREHFDSIIAQHGEIAIPMDMGMLIARN